MSKPSLIINADVHRKVMHWVNKSKFEVSGLGTVVKEKSGILRVTSAMLLPQKNTSTHTEIDADAVCKALYDLRDAEGELKWWWHSHVQMGVFWSGTDNDTIKELGKEGWIVATVFNQKNEVRSAAYAASSLICPWNDNPMDLFYDDLPFSVDTQEHPDTAKWDAEYKDRVENATAFPTLPLAGTSTGATLWDTRGRFTRMSTQGGGTTTEAAFWKRYTPEELEQAIRAEKASARPKGMSKYNWGFIKRASKEMQDTVLRKSKEFHYSVASIKSLEQPVIDGLSKEDWEILDLHDWCGQEITELMQAHSFTAKDLLLIAKAEFTPVEVWHLLGQGFTSQGVVKYAEGLVK